MQKKATKKKVAKKTVASRNADVRDNNGLRQGTEYVFKEDGTVDWRKMVDSDYLVFNADNFKGEIPQDDPEEYKKAVLNAKDSELLLLLGGARELAKLRGYSKIEYTPFPCSDDNATVRCRITWIPNFEERCEQVTDEIVCVHDGNTDEKIGRKYKHEIACNRSFVRNVRNSLGIFVMGKDEIFKGLSFETEDQGVAAPADLNLTGALADTMEKLKVSFESLKSRLVTEDTEQGSDWGAESWDSIKDIPKDKVIKIISRMSEALKKKQ